MSYAPLPTAAQAGVTRQLIADQQREIASSEEQILQYEARISALRSDILRLRDEISANEAYLAPIRRLPFEVLGDIIALRATDPDAPVQVLRDLASVCKTWRDATLRTPKAWTKIDVEQPRMIYLTPRRDEKGPRKKLQCLRDVQEWYARSGCCKKDVFLSPCEGDDFDAIVQLVLSRPSELRTWAPRGFWNDQINQHLLPQQSLPALQSLDISRSEVDNAFMTTLARSSPRLSCLRTGARSPLNHVLPIQARLKSLVLTTLTADHLLSLLRLGEGFMNLEALSAEVSFRRLGSVEPDVTAITLPNLRSLFLNLDDLSTRFLEILQVPRLESLALSLSTSGQSPKKEFAAFLNVRSAGDLALRELRLCGFWLADADLLQLLKRASRLELLVIVKGKTSDKVVAALSSRTTGRAAAWLCPNLSRLCVMSDKSSKSTKFRVSAAGMGECVTARLRANHTASLGGSAPPVARLAEVRLDCDDVVFQGRSSTDWWWATDEHSHAKHLDRISPSYDYDLYRPSWWSYTSDWWSL